MPLAARPRKRQLLAAVATAAALPVIPATASADSGCPTPAAYSGAGTVGDPFVIATPAHLQKLRDTSADWNDAVALSADINMGGCTWTTTIGQGVPFAGSLDGTGHIVSGLDISVTAAPAGFISILSTGGAVSNLGFIGDVTATVSDSQASAAANAVGVAGGLVGGMQPGSSIVRSFAHGDVSSVATAVSTDYFEGANATAKIGGLVGIGSGLIRDSYAVTGLAASVSASVDAQSQGSPTVLTMLGGLAGHLEGGSVIDSYSTATGLSSAQYLSGPGTANDWRGGIAAQLQNAPIVDGVVWDAGMWSTGAQVAGPAGTGVPTADLLTYAPFGPAGEDWSITDGYSASTAWSRCAGVNAGMPVPSVFLNSACQLGPVPAPEPEPIPEPGPNPDPAPPPQVVESRGGGAPSGAVTTSPSSATSVHTALRVKARDQQAIMGGRRAVLVGHVNSSGRIITAAWCERDGVPLSRRAGARLCGLSIQRRGTRVTARPTCSIGLVVKVRVNAKAAGARHATWSRSWRVSGSPPVPCRPAPNYAVTG